MEENKIVINGITYIREDIIKTQTKKLDGMDYCIVRTYSAGVFAGYISKREGKEVELVNSRRIWYWDGANSLSELAMSGTAKPEKCKFAVKTEKTILTEVIEIIYCTEAAKNSIEEVKEWKIK